MGTDDARMVVTVIIPVHNREDILNKTLDSVLDQDFQDWECIIVDDHSTDASLKVAGAYAAQDARFRVISLPDGKHGPSAGRNYGLAYALGQYINFLDSDDLFAPEKLQIQLDNFCTDPALEMVNCRISTFSDSPGTLTLLPCTNPRFQVEFLLRRLEYAPVWQSGCPLWRREALVRIGGWDETLHMGEDLELLLRASILGVKMGQTPQSLYFLRRGSNSRLSFMTRFEKNDYLRQTYLKCWALIETYHLADELRRKLCADNFYQRSKKLCENGFVVHGILDWIQDSQAIGQDLPRTLVGLLLLLTQSNQLTSWSTRTLRRIYFSHQNTLPQEIT